MKLNHLKLNHVKPNPIHRSRAGFTLVEILAVIGILGLLVSLSIPLIAKARATANRSACQMNLRQLAGTLSNYVDERRNSIWPKESGPKFFLTLVKDKEISVQSMKLFTCPGTSDVTYVNDGDAEGSAYKDWDNIDYDCVSFAGRDGKQFPVNKNKLDAEIIASDDNWFQGAMRANHPKLTNVVYADSHVDEIDISKYQSELPEDAEAIPVGPESPDEDLRKVLVDG